MAVYVQDGLDARVAKTGGDDEDSVSRMDGVSELGNLGGGEKPLLRVSNLGQVDAATGGTGDEAGCDCVAEDPSEELVGVAEGGRRIALGDQRR